MKYKVGQRVRVKSLEWYNENKDEYGYIDCGSRAFFTKMSDWCGKIATIKEICKTNCYRLEEYDFDWTDEMIEGLVEDENKPIYEDEVEDVFYSTPARMVCPSGYEFRDENGNTINAKMIVLNKKKNKYPKTFLECCDVLNIGNLIERGVKGYKAELFDTLQKLYICRDAYWKLYGEEMGLGKPWEPDWTTDDVKHSLVNVGNTVIPSVECKVCRILTFPTKEMRDDFKENFDPYIEICKELL